MQITFLTGFPDLASLCIEGHPTRNLAIEACANTLILIAGFSAAVNYRWDLFVKATERGRVHYLAAGPGFGARVNFETPALMGPTNYPYNNTTFDAKASLEYVYWVAKYFGFTMQFDLSMSYLIAEANFKRETSFLPGAKLSIGLAF